MFKKKSNPKKRRILLIILNGKGCWHYLEVK